MGDEERLGFFFSLAVGEPLFPLLLLLLLSDSDLNGPVWSGPAVASVLFPPLATVAFMLSENEVINKIFNKAFTQTTTAATPAVARVQQSSSMKKSIFLEESGRLYTGYACGKLSL